MLHLLDYEDQDVAMVGPPSEIYETGEATGTVYPER